MNNTSWKQLPVTLSRGLRFFDVTMIGIGAMIGAGIFGLTGIAAGKAGPVGLLVAFFLNGVVTFMTGLSYAELGAAIPAAGGGYSFVREGMTRFWGFIAGWISWFSNSVACSLYAVIFGAFFIELLSELGITFTTQIVIFNLSGVQVVEKILSIVVILLLVSINIRGASETGAVGNIITSFKIIVLMALVVSGLLFIFGSGSDWVVNFQNPPPADGSHPGGPFPNGLMGIFLAMGLTFVAFEGYEIIAQSGEELIDPARNLPRAIFYSIAIAVGIYLLVAFVSIGALVQDSGLPNWLFMAEEGEKAMIRTAEAIMPFGIGAIIMVLGGLASTTSALNATLYSSSRVAFAMGRSQDLPPTFGSVHQRNRTPHIAILTSGGLVILFASILPIQDVASGASLTFLLLFSLVNISLLQLRKNRPDLERPFRVPLVPWLPIFAILVQGALALTLFNVSWIAWVAVLIWLGIGVLVYGRLGLRAEAAQEADTILLEETIATSRAFSLLLPVSLAQNVRPLARLAASLAHDHDGEIFALHIIRVPQQLQLSDGRDFLKHGRPVLEEAIAIGKEYNVPVRTQLRLGRDISRSIMEAARERRANLIMLNWPGSTASTASAFGSIIDVISTNPPADLAVVRLVRGGLPKRILVPVVNNRNSQLALEIARSQAEYVSSQNGDEAEIVALHLVQLDADSTLIENRRKELTEELHLSGSPIELRMIPSEDPVQEILTMSERFDEIIIGAPEERLIGQQLFGSVPQRVAENAIVNVIMVKRHDPIKHGLLGRWINRVPNRQSYGQD
jgi:amino acid transporter/nucleotide-binding universal stress UspA family protein